MKREVTGWQGAMRYGRVLPLDKSSGGHRPCRERNQTYSKCDTGRIGATDSHEEADGIRLPELLRNGVWESCHRVDLLYGGGLMLVHCDTETTQPTDHEHGALTHGEVVELRQHRQGPANGVQQSCHLTHRHQGLYSNNL